MFQSIVCWTWIFICQICKWVEGSREQLEMAPLHSKNCILKGSVDFYCLVCETYLPSEEENIDHITKPIHKKNLDITQYVKDFEEDCVRKIKQGYFCELCNKLLPMMARVKIHVSELSHIDRKSKFCFKRMGGNVIVFGKVVLNNKAWNGLNDGSCAFCNTEYDNEEIHKNLKSHILNIIQTKVEVDENKNIYRKIDDTSFQCLTCNMVLALSNISCHFEDDQHKLQYQKCSVTTNDQISKNESLIREDLKEIDFKNKIEHLSDKTNNCLAKPLNETEVNTGQVHPRGGSDVKKIDMYETKEKKSETSISSVVNQDFANLKNNKEEDYDGNTSNKPKSQTKVLKDSDGNKINKNLEDKKLKKSETKQKIPELNETKTLGNSNLISESKRKKSRFNIEENEKKICKILRAEDYIALDENGKTLCILCDWIMDPKNKKTHITSQHHQTLEKLHKRRLAKMSYKNNKENIVSPNKSIIDLVSKFQANNININLISNTATCKKCTVSLPYNVTAIEEHILKHNETYENKVTLLSCDALDEETCENMDEATIKEKNNKAIAMENEIKEKLEFVEDKNQYKPTNKQSLVKVEETLSINEENTVINQNAEEKLKCFDEKNDYNKPTSRQGLEIKEEKTNMDTTSLKDEFNKLTDNPSETPTLQKQSLGNYITSLTGIKNMIFNDVIINDQICISASSFNYLLSINGQIKCSVCDTEVADIKTHINTLKHFKLLNEILVIVNEKSEFVREIQPELFQCGFCNITESSWSEMQEHFNSSFHLEIKNASEWRMQSYLKDIKAKNYNVSFNDSDSDSELLIRNIFSGLF